MIYNVALIGYGYWGPKLARNIQNSNKFQIHSIVDTSIKNLEICTRLYSLKYVLVCV